jgi:hypothetical protein
MDTDSRFQTILNQNTGDNAISLQMLVIYMVKLAITIQRCIIYRSICNATMFVNC